VHPTRPATVSGSSREIKTKPDKQDKQKYVPFTSEVNLGRVVALLVGSLSLSRSLSLVRRAICLDLEPIFLNLEIDFFFSVDTRVWDGSLRIFPFDARSTIELDFSLYSRLSSFRDSVTPVRRREDTEGDRDAGVKVQIDGCPRSFLECLSNCSRQLERLDKKRLDWGKSFSERRKGLRN
jgi:hypothetical protein